MLIKGREGFRRRMEINAARRLGEYTDNSDLVDVTTRLGNISVLVVSEDHAHLRYRINCLDNDFTAG